MELDAPDAVEGSSTLKVLFQGFAMIIASEIGDKTFLIAAILAMRHPRAAVFAGAFGSLVAMSFLSASLGHVLPGLLPRKWTQIAAAVLFFVFGAKMMKEGMDMEGGNSKILEEMKEAEEEIEEDDAEIDGSGKRTTGRVIPLEELEEGGRPVANGHLDPEVSEGLMNGSATSSRQESNFMKDLAEGARNFCSLLLGPVFVQSFVLTFLGEWGDRSQIATIALGAAHNVYVVTLGTVLGHSCCTALAVIGGRYVSTKISVKHVTLGGAVLFLLFGLIYTYEALAVKPDYDPSNPGDHLVRQHDY